VFDPTNPMRHTRIPATARLEDLREVVMQDGRRTRPAPTLDAIAERAQVQIARLPEGCRRLLNPHVYRVALSQALREERERMIEAVAADWNERRDDAR
jgi:nicotinate phosphoribosyltransferase